MEPEDLYELDSDRPDLTDSVLLQAMDGFVDAGATVLRPLATMFYGDRLGMVVDHGHLILSFVDRGFHRIFLPAGFYKFALTATCARRARSCSRWDPR